MHQSINRTTTKLVFCFMFLCAFPLLGNATKVYICTDEQGKKTFQNSPCEGEGIIQDHRNITPNSSIKLPDKPTISVPKTNTAEPTVTTSEKENIMDTPEQTEKQRILNQHLQKVKVIFPILLTLLFLKFILKRVFKSLKRKRKEDQLLKHMRMTSGVDFKKKK